VCSRREERGELLRLGLERERDFGLREKGGEQQDDAMRIIGHGDLRVG
jgi:hypothetical protein